MLAKDVIRSDRMNSIFLSMVPSPRALARSFARFSMNFAEIPLESVPSPLVVVRYPPILTFDGFIATTETRPSESYTRAFQFRIIPRHFPRRP
jgi:hypothetical protein